MYGKLGGEIQIKMKIMFLDYLYALPNATSGFDDIAVQTINALPSFTPLLMVFVFFVVFLGGISRQKMRSGFADYPMWSVIASMSTFLIALMLSLYEGLIHIDWLVVITVVTIFSGVWLFLDRKQSEV